MSVFSLKTFQGHSESVTTESTAQLCDVVKCSAQCVLGCLSRNVNRVHSIFPAIVHCVTCCFQNMLTTRVHTIVLLSKPTTHHSDPA